MSKPGWSIQALLDPQAPLPERRRGLGQLALLALVAQGGHLGLAWWAVPRLEGLPGWLQMGLLGFFALVLLGVGVLGRRPDRSRPYLGPARQVFWAALWLGVAGLAAIFAWRMGLASGALFFGLVGLWGWGLGLGWLWFRLEKA
ncbi:hypothetical protein [Meiothermus rufus]|uniref:hypothetical protein n=1 Tax=Meiothermus rufus TaxID=604332 RepID=UPI0004806676|nr:hypothetical protein [Meiothermus rufus]